MKIEGIIYNINYKKFKKGASFFIPCLDYVEAKKTINAICNRLKINVIIKGVIENNIKGVRIWRD